MIEFPANHPALVRLFDTKIPNPSVLWSVLLGRNSGKALVDNLESPTQCVLRTDTALTFFSPRIHQSFFDEAVNCYRRKEPVWLVWSESPNLHPPVPNSAQTIHRIAFRNIQPDSEILHEWRQNVPSGFAIRPIDRQLIERCEWRDEMAYYCGSLDNFMENGIGVCMMLQEEIVAEAYASSLGKVYAEIGAITRDNYRGRDFAPVVCAYLIEECLRQGYQPYWSCDMDNMASIRVAQKLGFSQSRNYVIYEYDPLYYGEKTI